MKYKAVIFDLDGTLVSMSADYRTWLVGVVLKDLGKPEKSQEEVDGFWFGSKGPRNDVISSWGLEPKEFWKVFRVHESPEKRSENSFAYDDVDVLNKLQDDGVKLGLVTNAQPYVVQAVIKKFNVDIFDAVVISHPHANVKPKPHPEGILGCMAVLEVEPEETVYIGDTPDDIAAARAAGVLDILIQRPDHPPIKNVEPTLTVASLHELYEKLSE